MLAKSQIRNASKTQAYTTTKINDLRVYSIYIYIYIYMSIDLSVCVCVCVCVCACSHL